MDTILSISHDATCFQVPFLWKMFAPLASCLSSWSAMHDVCVTCVKNCSVAMGANVLKCRVLASVFQRQYYSIQWIGHYPECNIIIIIIIIIIIMMMIIIIIIIIIIVIIIIIIKPLTSRLCFYLSDWITRSWLSAHIPYDLIWKLIASSVSKLETDWL